MSIYSVQENLLKINVGGQPLSDIQAQIDAIWVALNPLLGSSYVLMEDGTSHFLLEDGTGSVLLG
jgi:hypothetical protein